MKLFFLKRRRKKTQKIWFKRVRQSLDEIPRGFYILFIYVFSLFILHLFIIHFILFH